MQSFYNIKFTIIKLKSFLSQIKLKRFDNRVNDSVKEVIILN